MCWMASRESAPSPVPISPVGPPSPHSRPVDPRDMPAGALIEGKAKRYKAEDGPEASQQYSAMTVRSAVHACDGEG